MKCRICEKDFVINRLEIIGNHKNGNGEIMIWFNCTRCHGTYLRTDKELMEIIKTARFSDEEELKKESVACEDRPPNIHRTKFFFDS